MLGKSDERAMQLLEKHNNQNCCMRFLRKYRDNMPMGGIRIALFDYEDQDRMYSTFCSRIFGFIMLTFIGVLALVYMHGFGKVTDYEEYMVPYQSN